VAFLEQVRRILRAGDSMLLGTDLLKPVPQLLEAYDDPLGVTAAFNLNLLSRINRELDGDFSIHEFEHAVRFNEEERSVEMHLRSRVAQKVTVPRSDLTVGFEEGETIWTESSHKYLAEEVAAMGEIAGFRCDGQWIDRIWPFADTLFGIA
jgi:uncharacterized SAM-dependent methyltransferase